MERTNSRLGAVLLTSLLGAGAVAQVAAGPLETAAHPEGASNSAAVTPSQEALRAAMRKLWSDHVFWTREYVVAAIDGPEGAAKAAADRLMRNQEDIGHAVATYYGAAAGENAAAGERDPWPRPPPSSRPTAVRSVSWRSTRSASPRPSPPRIWLYSPTTSMAVVAPRGAAEVSACIGTIGGGGMA